LEWSGKFKIRILRTAFILGFPTTPRDQEPRTRGSYQARFHHAVRDAPNL
jgi:hypothetical protein